LNLQEVTTKSGESQSGGTLTYLGYLTALFSHRFGLLGARQLNGRSVDEGRATCYSQMSWYKDMRHCRATSAEVALRHTLIRWTCCR